LRSLYFKRVFDPATLLTGIRRALVPAALLGEFAIGRAPAHLNVFR
jgi:hypothetical protein